MTFFFYLFHFEFCYIRLLICSGRVCCETPLCRSFQQTVRSLWAASCPKRLAFSQDCVSCVPKKNVPNTWNWKEPKAEQKDGAFFHHCQAEENNRPPVSGHSAVKLKRWLSRFLKKERQETALHGDPNLFIIIPLQADSTSKKEKKKRKITSRHASCGFDAHRF